MKGEVKMASAEHEVVFQFNATIVLKMSGNRDRWLRKAEKIIEKELEKTKVKYEGIYYIEKI